MKTMLPKKGISLIFISVILLHMSGINPASAQSQKMAFADWLSTTGSQNYFHKGLTKTDGSGNVYIAGATINGSGNNDILIAKYNSEGVQQWINQYNGGANLEDVGAGCFIDGSGNVYVSGTTQTSATNSDMILIKYNSSGTQQWLRTYNGTGSSFDSGSDMYVDGSGNVYMTGSGYNASGNTDVITLKYNSSGTQQWVKYLNYNGNNDAGVKIAPYGSYVIVAVIAQYNTNSYYYGLLQYAMSNGNLAASSITGSSTTNIELVNDMVVDPSGYIYICGSTPVQGQGYDYTVIKLNVNLGLSWERTYNGDDDLDDCAKGLRVDASGNVYVTGYSTTNAEGLNIITLKYNSSGTLQWTEKYNNDLDGDDEAYAMAMDNSGNIYVTGYTSTEIDGLDVFTIKYDSNANLIWSVKNDGPYHLNDKSTNIAINNSGEIFIAALSETAPGVYQYLTVKYLEYDIIIPSDYNTEDTNRTILYHKNSGQIVDTDYDPVSDIDFYSHNSSPEFYFQNNSHSMVFASIDTSSSTEDSLHRIDVTFQRCNASSKAYPLEELKEYFNYYLGYCEGDITHVYGNQKLVIPSLYDNIDLLYSSNQNGIKYYFIIKPGGDPSDIVMELDGADSIAVDGATNDFTIYSSVGNLIYERPTAYQIDQYNNVDTITGWSCAWDKINSISVDFYTSTYNTSLPLIIQVDLGHALDPASDKNMMHSTYYGGTMSDHFNDITTDINGNIYFTGESDSQIFPTVAGNITTTISSDVILIKYNNDFTPAWGLYYGGGLYTDTVSEGNDEGISVVYGDDFNIFMVGNTQSSNLPLWYLGGGAYMDSTLSGSALYKKDMFLTRFNSDGDLRWSTYFGGSTDNVYEYVCDAAVDSLENFYIVGRRDGNTPLKTLANATNDVVGKGYIAKFTWDGVFTWASAYGGNAAMDEIHGIAIDNHNNVIVTGATKSSTGFHLVNPGGGAYFDSVLAGPQDAFIGKFNTNNYLYWSTFFGGDEYDKGYAVATDSYRNIYITGDTRSEANFPFYNAVSPYNVYHGPFSFTLTTYGDAFVAKFNGDGVRMKAMMMGGSYGDVGLNITVDAFDRAFLTGVSESSNFPHVNLSTSTVWSKSTLSNCPDCGNDAVIIGLSFELEPFWSTYYGGGTLYDGGEWGNGITTFDGSKLYVVGETGSTVNFPKYNMGNGAWFQSNLNGSYSDGTLAYFSLDPFPVGVSETYLDIDNDITVFPNPSDGIANIKVSCTEKTEFQLNVFNNTGTIIMSEKISTLGEQIIPIDFTGLSKGIYLIQIVSGNKTTSKKVIIL